MYLSERQSLSVLKITDRDQKFLCSTPNAFQLKSVFPTKVRVAESLMRNTGIIRFGAGTVQTVLIGGLKFTLEFEMGYSGSGAELYVIVVMSIPRPRSG